MADYEITERAAHPYAAIAITTSMKDLGADAPPLHGELYGWLHQHGAAPTGPAFWKYNLVQMPERLELEVGSQVEAAIEGDGRVVAGELPAGRYLETLHQGHPDTLEKATGELLAYAQAQGLSFDEDSDRWVARVEYYLDDPVEQPDMNQWQTLLSFKLA